MELEGQGSKLVQKKSAIDFFSISYFQNLAHTFVEDHMLITCLEFVHMLIKDHTINRDPRVSCLAV